MLSNQGRLPLLNKFPHTSLNEWGYTKHSREAAAVKHSKYKIKMDLHMVNHEHTFMYLPSMIFKTVWISSSSLNRVILENEALDR